MKTIILLLACLALSGAARADDSKEAPLDKGAYLIGPRLVYYLPEDGKNGTWNPGLQARYNFAGHWAVEGAGDYQRHSFPDTTAHTAALQASLEYYWGPPRAHVFGIGGVGYFISRVNGPSYRRNIGRAAPHVGAGAEFVFTKDWSADATYRHVFIDDLETRDANTNNLKNFKRSGEQFTFAINRRWGASDPK